MVTLIFPSWNVDYFLNPPVSSNMKRFVSLLACVGCVLAVVDGARILIFICQEYKSHHIMFHPVIRELALRGHRVDYYTHHPLNDPPKDLNQTIFNSEGVEDILSLIDAFESVSGYNPLPLAVNNFRKFKFRKGEAACYQSIEAKELLSSNRTYDMVIGEFSMIQEDYTYLIHKFNALGVTMQSLPDYEILHEMSGLPSNPSYQIHFLSTSTYPMKFLEKLYHFGEIMITRITDYYYLNGPYQRHADEHLRYDGWEKRPPITMQMSDLALILVNGHHSFGFAYPKAPHVKEVLGMNILTTLPPLPKDIEKFIDNAKDGIILFSMGSTMSVNLIKKLGGFEPLVKAFSNLKLNVLWKWTSWNGTNPPVVPGIKFSKWLPQQTILAHNKTKVFITHGGLGGLTEGIYYGVPMIGIPTFTDQHKNVKLMTSLGLGLSLHWSSMSETSISSVINEIIYNPKYKKEVLRRSAIFKDRPMKPVEESIYWIEYVLRHGKILQPVSAKMRLYELYLLDIIGFLFVVWMIFILVVNFLVKRIWKMIFSFSYEKVKSNSKLNKSNSKKNK